MAVESTMLPLGTEAPAFTLPTPDGTAISFDDVAGERATLVAFLCNHCPYVVHVAEALGRLAAAWREDGVGVVGIMSNDVEAYPDDAPAHMSHFAAAQGWDFPYLYDEDQSVARAYRAACTPDFFLFDAQRQLAYRGRLDGSRPRTDVPVTGVDLGAAVAAVVGGAPVPEPQRPSLGCSIKWRPGTEPAWAP